MTLATLTAPGIEVQIDIGTPFDQCAKRADMIKVLLWFETDRPHHLSAKLLQAHFAFEGPFVESVAVLMDPAKVFDLIEAYLDNFERLKDSKLVPSDARLISYDIIEEDERYLAWVM
jgi:hypothetical protein